MICKVFLSKITHVLSRGLTQGTKVFRFCRKMTLKLCRKPRSKGKYFLQANRQELYIGLFISLFSSSSNKKKEFTLKKKFKFFIKKLLYLGKQNFPALRLNKFSYFPKSKHFLYFGKWISLDRSLKNVYISGANFNIKKNFYSFSYFFKKQIHKFFMIIFFLKSTQQKLLEKIYMLLAKLYFSKSTLRKQFSFFIN